MKKKKRTDRDLFFHAAQRYGRDILTSENFRASENHIQHGNMSVRRHSINVAQCSFAIARRLGIKYNRRDLLRGALLHDYFLYDWHLPEHRNIKHLHGFYHPGIALKNAEKEYRLDGRQRDIIRKHMWPLTVVPPMCREAWIVTVADKYCSAMETLYIHQGKKYAKRYPVKHTESMKLHKQAKTSGKKMHVRKRTLFI